MRRNRIRQADTTTLEKRVKELVAFEERTGSFDVPRSGDEAELGKWLDKLKESYAKRPNGGRADWLHRNAPKIHEHLVKWRATRVGRSGTRRVPFWLNAAWALEFMNRHGRVPSRMSEDGKERATAKWLQRWTSTRGLEEIHRDEDRHEVALELMRLGKGLKSEERVVVERARKEVEEACRGEWYDRLSAMCLNSAWTTAERREKTVERIAKRQKFWPGMGAGDSDEEGS